MSLRSALFVVSELRGCSVTYAEHRRFRRVFVDCAFATPILQAQFEREAYAAQRNCPLFFDTMGFLLSAGLPQHTHALILRCHEFHTKPAATTLRALAIPEAHRACLLYALAQAEAFVADTPMLMQNKQRTTQETRDKDKDKHTDKDKGTDTSAEWDLNAELDAYLATEESKQIELAGENKSKIDRDTKSGAEEHKLKAATATTAEQQKQQQQPTPRNRIGDLSLDALAADTKTKEDRLRELFVREPTHADIADPYVLTQDVWKSG